MRHPIINPNQSYTFRDYFDLNPPIDELLAYFGYTKRTEMCNWAKADVDLSFFAGLKQQFEAHLRITELTTETAKREVLVAPILLNLGVYLQTKVYIEYPLQVSKQLKGKIDYYLPCQGKGNLLVVEAKHDDLSRGFTQLAVELIAFDQWLDENDKPLYGIITIGDAWRFGILDRLSKQITQDIHLYRVPDDVEELLRILIAILEDKPC